MAELPINGGYAGNPTITAHSESEARGHGSLVQINPRASPRDPTARLEGHSTGPNEIPFQCAVDEGIADDDRVASGRDPATARGRRAQMRTHRIMTDSLARTFGASSKLNAERAFFRS